MQSRATGSRTGFLLSVVTACMWGVLPIALKLSLERLDAYTITWWRLASVALLLGAVLAWQRRLPPRSALDRHTALLLVIATLGLLANFVLYLVALDHTSPSIAQVVIQVAPLMLLLGGVFLLRERFAPRQWAGFAVLGAGLLLFFNERLPELARPGEGLGLGVALLLAASATWASYGLAQKRLLARLSVRQILWIIFTGCAILLAPFAAWRPVLALGPLHAWALVFCCVNTLVAYVSFAEALRHWEVSRVSAVIATAPLVTVAAMWLLERIVPGLLDAEGLSAASIAGALLVVAGSMVSALANRPGARPVTPDI